MTLPLSALLSAALVSFTIEFDNEAELRIPHQTTSHGRVPRTVWLVSMAMYLNCMRYVGSDPVTVAEVARLARTGTNLDGMRRWGYVTVEPGSGGAGSGGAGQVLRATPNGLRAREIWEPLTGEIEQRWRDRFGADEIEALRGALAEVAGQVGGELPDCLPILGYGLYTTRRGPGGAVRWALDGPASAPGAGEAAALPLPWLLARVLLALTVAYEGESRVALAITANLLRVLDERGVRVRDLPLLTGVSKEGLAMATGFCGKGDLVVVGPDPDGGRWKVVRLTPKGALVRDAYADRLDALEDRWRSQFGAPVVASLRASLEQLAGSGEADSPLFKGLEPQPENWRTDVRPPQTLPHFPLVLHRGGYPDGS